MKRRVFSQTMGLGALGASSLVACTKGEKVNTNGQTGVTLDKDLISHGMPAKKDFCGWTGLVPIALYKEYIEKA